MEPQTKKKMQNLRRTALISCFDKTGLAGLSNRLISNNYRIISTGGTYQYLQHHNPESKIIKVEEVTKFPEILNGRVKTLHPNIHGGLLANRDDPSHMETLQQHEIDPIDLVVVNLYPFWLLDPKTVSDDEAIELIDIGGVAMLRAAAKNYKHITVISDPSQYRCIDAELSLEQRRQLASQAFAMTTQYDSQIANYLSRGTSTIRVYNQIQPLKYGCNPHQTPAALHGINGQTMPYKLLNGDWGYINVLDAVGCWGLVAELSKLTGRVAACSFKHTSPAGAAVSVNWNNLPRSSQILLSTLFGLSESSSDAVNAYSRSRNADPQSSFGDFIGMSCIVDEELALAIKPHVSDGIVAPGYTVAALKILSEKKKGQYVIVQSDPDFVQRDPVEYREVGGCMALSQATNTLSVTLADLDISKIVTANKEISDAAKLDLLVANACLKYAQSNNVACATQGQLIGLSAGQQSRVHSVRLACQKARVWLNRHGEECIEAVQKSKGSPFQDRINASTTIAEDEDSCGGNYEISLASDAFFPFSDSITVASPHWS
jgi:phosphoribosylaminoimidazolecarboxamide formyltransferase / IMP cyclohydrolase